MTWKSGYESVTQPAKLHVRTIAEIYRTGDNFLPLIVWVYLYSVLHSELRKKAMSRLYHSLVDCKRTDTARRHRPSAAEIGLGASQGH